MLIVTAGRRAIGYQGSGCGGERRGSRIEMDDGLLFALFLAGWFVLVRFVLPRFGVPT